MLLNQFEKLYDVVELRTTELTERLIDQAKGVL
jgi:acetolactate synthase regulatory subunit